MSESETQPSRHHAIDYIEIPAPDLAAAKRFYGEVFGWRFNDYGPGPDYVGIQAPSGEGEVGGFSPEGAPGAAGVLVQMWSDDLDATLAAVTASGGTVSVGPFDFPGGRRFHFRDPAGNELGVWGAPSP